MIAVDTNVLVRYYVDDDHVQHQRAVRFVDENEIFVNSIVIVETFWVLSSVYRLSKQSVCDIFNHLKRLSNVLFENETVLARALAAYRARNCDFADAIVGALNEYYGFQTVSFDKAAARVLGFRSP